jgi:hypothetical protein
MSSGVHDYIFDKSYAKVLIGRKIAAQRGLKINFRAAVD